MTNFAPGDRVRVVANDYYGHHFPTGTVGTVAWLREYDDCPVVAVDVAGPFVSSSGKEHPDGIQQRVHPRDIELVAAKAEPWPADPNAPEREVPAIAPDSFALSVEHGEEA